MTHAPPLTLTTPLSAVPSVGPSRAAKLRKLKLRIARDVLFLFPRDFEHPPASAGVDELVDGQSVTLTGTVTDAELVSRNPGRSIFGAILENDSGAVRLVFFNQPFRADQLPIGRRIRVRGVAKLNGLRFELTHPNVVTLTDDEE
ncbi:MAG: OB-fold nucleic acid binding domain-containing protein, partial [Planctomycetota bacterium]